MMPTSTSASEHRLAGGRLHPSSVLLHLVRVVLKNILLFAFLLWQALSGDEAALTQMGWFAGLAALSVLAVGSSVVEYLTCRYQLTDRFLYIQRGYFRRLERRIPIDRVQDLTSEEGPLRRLFGVVRVAVQTSSTEGAEAQLDSITPGAFEALRRALQQAQAAPGLQTAQPASPEICTVSTKQLVQLGLTDSRAAVILLLIGGAVGQVFEAADMKVVKPVIAWGGQLFKALQQQSVWSLLVGGLLVTLLLWAAGLVASIALNVLRFHGFALTEADGTLRRRYGLLNRQEHALPRGRIQAVWVKQTLLRRWLGLAVMKIHSMGTAADKAAAQQSGTNVFIPVGNRSQLEALVRRILPELDHRGLKWHPISSRIIRRYFTRGLVLSAALLGAGLPTLGLPALAALGLPLVFAAAAAAIHRTMRWAVRDGLLAVRKGVLGRQLALVPLRRVQCVTVVSNPIERLQDLARLYVVLGGGAAVTIPYLTTAQADELQRRLARTTSRLAAVDVPVGSPYHQGRHNHE
jgi:putative membrane protein